jgi:hypothetical protein
MNCYFHISTVFRMRRETLRVFLQLGRAPDLGGISERFCGINGAGTFETFVGFRVPGPSGSTKLLSFLTLGTFRLSPSSRRRIGAGHYNPAKGLSKMSINLPLEPQKEARLLAIAQSKGLSSADDLVREAIDKILADAPEALPRKTPTRSLRGLLAKYGPAPSAEEIDENRAEMFANFPRSDF